MWPAVDDVARSFRASLKLLSTGGVAPPDFDLTRMALGRSYTALMLTLPALVPILAAQMRLGADPASHLFDAPDLLLSIPIAASLMVVAVPALLIALAPPLLRAPAFTAFVISWNWTAVFSIGVLALPATVFALGWAPPALALLQTGAFALILLRLRFCVARAAFGERALALLVTAASLLVDYAVLRTLGLFGL